MKGTRSAGGDDKVWAHDRDASTGDAPAATGTCYMSLYELVRRRRGTATHVSVCAGKYDGAILFLYDCTSACLSVWNR